MPLVSVMFLEPVTWVALGVAAVVGVGFALLARRLDQRRRSAGSADGPLPGETPAQQRQRELDQERRRREEPPRSGRRPHPSGMTWGALVGLLVMLGVLAGETWQVLDPRFPPAGAATQQAEVVSEDGLGDNRPGSNAPDYDSLEVRLADGTTAWVLYEERWIGQADVGDTLTVYPEDADWRTTSERSTGALVGMALGLSFYVLLVLGWWRSRRHDRQRDRQRAEAGEPEILGLPPERLRRDDA